MKKSLWLLCFAAMLLLLPSCGDDKNTLSVTTNGVCLNWNGTKTSEDLSLGIQWLSLNGGNPQMTKLPLRTNQGSLQFPQHDQSNLETEAAVIEVTGDSISLTLDDKKIVSHGTSGFLLIKDKQGKTWVMKANSNPPPVEGVDVNGGNIYIDGESMGNIVVLGSEKLPGGLFHSNYNSISFPAMEIDSFKTFAALLTSGTGFPWKNDTSGAVLVNVDDFKDPNIALDACCDSLLKHKLSNAEFNRDIAATALRGSEYTYLAGFAGNNICIVRWSHYIIVKDCNKTGDNIFYDSDLGKIVLYADIKDNLWFVQEKQNTPPTH